MGIRSTTESSTGIWTTYYKPISFFSATRVVVKDEGSNVGPMQHGSPKQCMEKCWATAGCNSFSHDEKTDTCWLKDKCIESTTEVQDSSDWVTYYTPCYTVPP